MSRQMREALAELEARGAKILEAPESLNEARMILRELGPQRVGGRYRSGMWDMCYTVEAITIREWRWAITVRWDDGYTTTHETSWDHRRDRVA